MTVGYRPEIVQRAFIGLIGSQLHPFWSLTVPKLRLIAKQILDANLIALQFEMNYAFKRQAFDLKGGWQGGQHLNLSVPINGVNHQRSYSLVGMPADILWWNDDPLKNNTNRNKKSQVQTVTIAVKPQGLVSDYLTKQVAIGTIFDSSVPTGKFTLAHANVAAIKQHSKSSSTTETLPLLFIAGGSGITPMLGLITQALTLGHQVTLLHYNRTALLTSYWQTLSIKYPTFTYHLINTDDPTTYLANSRHLSAQSLRSLALPLADIQIFACGSQALLAGLYSAANEITLLEDNQRGDKQSLRDRIIIENFGNAVINCDSDNHDIDKTALDIEPKTITLRTRQRQFDSDTTLLLGAEQAGMRLPYGCRQGICQLCRCNKVSGVVKNIKTGKLSSDGYESIQTCISIAMTDVVLDV